MARAAQRLDGFALGLLEVRFGVVVRHRDIGEIAVRAAYGGAGVNDVLDITFAPQLRASADVRRTVSSWLGRRVDPAVGLDDLLLVVSELVTNAVLHAHTPARFVLRWDGRCARIEVTDGDHQLPRVPVEAPAIGGRGLFLVDRLSTAWGSDPSPSGKTVWATVEVTP